MPNDNKVIGDPLEDVLDDTSNEQEEEIEKVENKELEEENEEDDELEDKEEDKEEEELEGDEEDEDTEVIVKPRISDIKKEFPGIFTKFPDLKDAFFKSYEYEKLFPTIDDAKEAFNDNEAYLNLRESVLSGNPELLLTGLKSTDTEAYTLFTRRLLPTLFKNDKDLYTEVVTPAIEGLFKNAFKEAKKHSNENLENACLELVEHIFGSDELLTKNITYTKELKATKPEEVTQRETELYNSARNDCAEKIDKSIRLEIRKGLDPNNELVPFIRKSIISSVVRELDKQLGVDTKFQATQSARWGVAKRKGFDESSKRQLINAALARIKPMIPQLREKFKNAALGSAKKRSDDTREQITRNTPNKREITGGNRNVGKGKLDSSKIDYSKTSDLDLFEDRVVLKR
jgi:hypothetical protein